MTTHTIAAAGAVRRRLVRNSALFLVASLAIASCGQAGDANEETTDAQPGQTGPTGESGAGDGGPATIRFSWWGGGERVEISEALMEAFTAEYPDISIVPDFTDWGGYWDKLATQTAAGDTPDVMMQEERYLREYADRGVLADLSSFDIDTTSIDDSVLGSGEFSGGLWGIATGVNVRVLLTNTQVISDAGLDLPDDTTWTWDDYHDLMASISENSSAGTFGAEQFGFIESDLAIWLRQHGQNLWDEDGEIGFEPELMAELWQRSLDLVEAGGVPPVSMGLEQVNASIEQTLVGTGRAAVIPGWSNTVVAMDSTAEGDVIPLRYPGETQFERAGLFLKPAMAVSMSANTEHPEAAAKFIDWMLNDPQAGEIILTDRGLPANVEVREHVTDYLSDTDQSVAAFIADVSESIVDAAPAPPRGAGQVADLLSRINEEVLFGGITPQEGAERFIAEASDITG